MPDFDWKVDEEAAWQEPERPTSPPQPTRRRGRWLWTITALVLLSAIFLFYTRLNRQIAQTATDQTEEVTAAFRLLWQADRQGDVDLFTQLRHDTGRHAWRTEMDRIFAAGLLFDRAVLGLMLSGTEPEVGEVTFSPDWQTAVLTAHVAYHTAYDLDPIHLSYPLFYERIEGRWLLVPPADDYEGEMVQADGRYLTLRYPQADAELATRLHQDLERAVAQACDQSVQPPRLLALNCPPDLSLNLPLQPQPGSLDWLLLDKSQERIRMQQSTFFSSNSIDLALPTFSLLGLAEDEAAYTAVQRALSYWLLVLLYDGYYQPSDHHIRDGYWPVPLWFWLQAQLEQLGLATMPTPASPPIALSPPQQPPQAEVALLCADPATHSMDLLRLSPATAEWSLLAADTNHVRLTSLAQGQLLGFHSLGYDESAPRGSLLLRPDGTPLSLPPLPNNIPLTGWLDQPGRQPEIGIAWTGQEYMVIDLAACLREDEALCRWRSSVMWLTRSPDGRQHLSIYDRPASAGETGGSPGLIRQNALDDVAVAIDIGRNLPLTWGDTTTASLGLHLLPFWLDNDTYGYMRVPAGQAEGFGHHYFDIVIADSEDDEPQPFLTSDAIRAVLPSEPQPGSVMPRSVRRVAGQTDQFVLIITVFPVDLLLLHNLQPISVALHYDRADESLRLLVYGERLQLDFSANGRFLLQWPAEIWDQSGPGNNSQGWQIVWLDMTTGIEENIDWPQPRRLGTAAILYDWSPSDEWFLLLVDDTLLLVEATANQSGYVISLTEHLGKPYRCFNAVWMKTTE